ncbi:hypothetical protein HUG17_2464 [Dermatophagoides farinae]|uniref:Uncharacterized protein n=1 Tax=Dermatophagoides farinae TaxID=6954 RepID=A0A9D4NUA6_DERFA|nr:hypothetical protein HUG17_2464 [Dermatophagoides farinae]
MYKFKLSSYRLNRLLCRFQWSIRWWNVLKNGNNNIVIMDKNHHYYPHLSINESLQLLAQFLSLIVSLSGLFGTMRRSILLSSLYALAMKLK